MDEIRKFFQNKYIDFTERDWQIVSSKLTHHQVAKKHLLLEIGQVENYISFIEEGVVRYYIPKETNDLTLEFTFANDFAGSYESFLTRQPSQYHVETITPATLWRISHNDIQDLYSETEKGNTIGRLAAEALFLQKSRREFSLLTDSAETRYLKLFTEQPELIKQIPLHYIASYIGITPQALSRIRSKIS